jgi:glycosyltransferase involved in cell wall biosynthesis
MSGVVLHVAKASGISGSENHLLLLLPGLRARGWDVRLLLLHESEPGAKEFATRLRDAEVPVTELTLARSFDPRAFRRVLAHVRHERPVLLHTHLVHADFYGLTAGRLAGIPVLASTKHGFNAFRGRKAFGMADRTIARVLDLHIAISRGLAEYLAASEGFDVAGFEVVHYGIEPGPEPSSPTPGPRLAVVGRLIPIKGLDTLLEAVADVPGVDVEIAGDGPLRASLQADIDARGLGSRAHLLGRVAPAGPVLERAAIVVVPSLGEGFGMVALEAMERGRAVIASSVGGLPEIVADGETGLLVPPGDPVALAAAIRRLVADPERVIAMGAAGRRRAVEVFGQDRCTRRTAELYEGALARA